MPEEAPNLQADRHGAPGLSVSAVEAAYADGRRWGARPFGHVGVCPYPLSEERRRNAWLDGFLDARRDLP